MTWFAYWTAIFLAGLATSIVGTLIAFKIRRMWNDMIDRHSGED